MSGDAGGAGDGSARRDDAAQGSSDRRPPESPAPVRELDAATRRKIAAGEIVSRPVDVAVELVENALDAGATRIEVGVWGDGTERVRVADDGRGMSREDAELAVERHTTSKLGDAADVERIETLGFRGEALPSIAAAADLEVVTNDGGQAGTRVVVSGGDGAAGDAGETRVEETGRGRGTTVEVRDLFTERPARRKSLASTAAEFGRISDAVAARALVHPGVAVTLDHDDATAFSTPGTGDYADALLGVYGREVARESATFEHETTVEAAGAGGAETGGAADPVPVRVEGVLTYPSTTRAARDHVRVAVNGRSVGNAGLRTAVVAGYGTLLPDGRYPVAAVDVSVPPAAVDPNVDPAKREVAFRDADAVRDAVEAAVSETLTTADLRRSGDVTLDLGSSLSAVDGEEAGAFGGAAVVGQFRETYLLFEADGDLLVLDQHAAHERVNFERLRTALADEAVPSVDLDPPETLTLPPGEVASVEEHAEELAALGFDVDPFGGGTVRLRAVPAPLGRAADSDALRETLDALAQGANPDRREELLKDLACHPSLKAGDALDDEAARTLLAELGACEQPFACPHGRPTVLSIEESTLARGFERGERRLD
jgi:DNA mismatch repair protein MutL